MNRSARRFACLHWLPLAAIPACTVPTDVALESQAPAFLEGERRVLLDRGYPDAVELVPRTTGVAGERFAGQLNGIRIAGVGARRNGDRSRLAAPRVELASEPAATPVIDRSRALALAESAVVRASQATVVRGITAELVYEPRYERRMIHTPVDREVTATDFERVIVGLDLRWRARVEADGAGWAVAIDAIDGSARNPRRAAFPLAPAQLADVTGLGHYHGTRTLRVSYDPAFDEPYDLIDARGNTFAPMSGPIYSSADVEYGDGELTTTTDFSSANAETAAVDAFLAVEVVWRTFTDKLNLQSPLVDPTATVDLRVHRQFQNSSWDPVGPTLYIGYRDLTATPRRPMSTVDIVGHELGHGFMAAASGTTIDDYGWFDEFGGLHEATGDIIGTIAEHHRQTVLPGTNPGNFTMGEETGPPSRTMYWPQFQTWSPTLEQDAQDPHLIAGPIDRMFYILCEGLEPYNSTTGPGNPRMSSYLPAGLTPIGMDDASWIWRDTVGQLDASDDFAMTRQLALQAADEAFGWDSVQRKAVGDAFAAVNIGTPADRSAPTILSATTTQIPEKVRLRFWVRDNRWITRKPPLVWFNTNKVTYQAIEIERSFGFGGYKDTLFQVDVSNSWLRAFSLGNNHSATITAWDDWGNKDTSSHAFQADVTGPALTASVGGSGKTPIINATASDSSGVNRVEVRRGTVLLGTDLSAPYSVQFDTSTWPDGGHAITVTAFDGWENSRSVTITVTADNTAPVVTLSGSTGTPPFTIAATATDASTLSNAVFAKDGVPQSIDTTQPFTWSYAPQDANPHTLSVVVTDSYGNQGSATLPAPYDQTPPTISAEASQYMYTVTIAGSVIDTCGLQYPLSVVVDGVEIAQPTQSTFSVQLPAALFAPGTHTLEIDATDRCGNTRHQEQTFPVYTNIPIVSVVIEQTSDPKQPKVRATVTHDRPIQEVVFRRMAFGQTSVIVGTDTTAPYELELDTSTWPDGTYDIAAVATDDIGWPGQGEQGPVRADNTPPQIGVSWQHANCEMYYSATATDGDGSGLSGPMSMAIFLVTGTFQDPAPPYTFAYTIPTNLQQGDLWFIACMSDAFENEGCGGVNVRVTRNKTQCTAMEIPAPKF